MLCRRAPGPVRTLSQNIRRPVIKEYAECRTLGHTHMCTSAHFAPVCLSVAVANLSCENKVTMLDVHSENRGENLKSCRKQHLRLTNPATLARLPVPPPGKGGIYSCVWKEGLPIRAPGNPLIPAARPLCSS